LLSRVRLAGFVKQIRTLMVLANSSYLYPDRNPFEPQKKNGSRTIQRNGKLSIRTTWKRFKI